MLRSRRFGFVLLILGFLWLCWDGTDFRSWVSWRQAAVAHYDRLPKDTSMTFSRSDMHTQIRDTAKDAVGNTPSYVLPGLIMLAGGIILGRSRAPNGLTKRSSQPLTGEKSST